MALKLLNPGLRPLGQFDLLTGEAITGGEYVELRDVLVAAGEAAAADVQAMANAAGDTPAFGFPAAGVGRTAGQLGGLSDDGVAEYGTHFGSVIGGNAGAMTQFGDSANAILVGPRTTVASGKVTVWAAPGLYGVTTCAGVLAANAVLAGPLGTLTVGGDGDAVATYVSAVNDTSLVSTTALAAGEAAELEYHAVFYLGNAQA
jgi:hypothetical protein